MAIPPLKLENFPLTLSKNEAVALELVEGIPIFRASSKVQERIELLLEKQKQNPLHQQEELDQYEDLDDYLSLVNRTIRNLYLQ